MRAAIWICAATLAAVGCKKDSATPNEGSAVAATPATPPRVVADAPATPADAAASATFEISERGVGPITDLSLAGKDEGDEPERAKLTGLLKPIGLTVGFEVMDMPGDVETEEGYFSAKKGDQEVLQIFRTDPVTIHVVDPMFATSDGLKVGDTGAVLAAKRKNIECRATIGDTLGDLTCRDPGEPHIVFVLAAKGVKASGKPLPVAKFADRGILQIVR